MLCRADLLKHAMRPKGEDHAYDTDKSVSHQSLTYLPLVWQIFDAN